MEQAAPAQGQATVDRRQRVSFVNYYNNARGLIYGLQKVKGDISGGQKALQKAMDTVSVVAPNGYRLKLDNNRQAIADTFVQQLFDDNGALAVKTVYKVTGVAQTFGGAFSPTKPAPSGRARRARSRRVASLKVTKVWSEREGHPLTEATAAVAADSADPILRFCGGRSALGRCNSAQRRISTSPTVSAAPSWARTARERRPCTTLIAGDFAPTSGTIDGMGTDVTLLQALPEALRPHLPEVPPLPGSSVEGQTSYLAIVG